MQVVVSACWSSTLGVCWLCSRYRSCEGSGIWSLQKFGCEGHLVLDADENLKEK